jgi:hypothetical protein
MKTGLKVISGPFKLVAGVGFETTADVFLCVFTRVSARVKRTKAHRNPSELLQTATT